MYIQAPAKAVSRKHTFKAINYYSKKDYVTKGAADTYSQEPGYAVEFLECKTPWYERTGCVADHDFLGRTYTEARENIIKDIRKEYGFYDPKTR